MNHCSNFSFVMQECRATKYYSGFFLTFGVLWAFIMKYMGMGPNEENRCLFAVTGRVYATFYY